MQYATPALTILSAKNFRFEFYWTTLIMRNFILIALSTGFMHKVGVTRRHDRVTLRDQISSTRDTSTHGVEISTPPPTGFLIGHGSHV